LDWNLQNDDNNGCSTYWYIINLTSLGFSFGGLVLEVEANMYLSLFYLITTVFSMGFGLLCLTIGSFCLMFGQGRALRGEGIQAVTEAIDNLQSNSFRAFKYFILQLLCFHLSSFLLMWCYYHFIVAIIINAVLGTFLVMFVMNGKEILERLWVSEGEAVVGKFNLFGESQEVVQGDLDRRRKQNQEYY